ncbi:YHS domain-containing protein [Nocardia nova SH22a]|uniref:YHS domain-containing protein n=1 Tax=Nocardia nova SH22a TaxID=1415166 RepID=W5TMV0_9NOCA|nr:YHS domain-containing protein [Nocardia nova]AHH20313.1 YHS domain-containing protein [Nocardia nova SH22a]
MMTIELSVSPGALPPERRTELAERILHALTTGESAPPQVLDRARELTHVLIHTPETWVTGGPGPATAPRYLVRVTVPGSWSNTDGFGSHVIGAITDAIAATESDPGRLRRDPHCLVQIIGLRDGGVGTLGHATSATEITRMITQDYRPEEDRRPVPDGHTIDPVCGMTVEWATAQFTLRHDGVDYAFCAPGCRKVFVAEHAAAQPG